MNVLIPWEIGKKIDLFSCPEVVVICIYEAREFVLFCLSHSYLPNHGASCYILVSRESCQCIELQ